MIFGYSANDNSYLGVWNGTSFSTTSQWYTDMVYVKSLASYNLRLVLANSEDTAVTPEVGVNLVFMTFTDETLQAGGVPADAKSTGAAINKINAKLDKITITGSVNLIDPATFINRGYYYDTSDGVTHVESSSGYMSEEIDVTNCIVIYVRQNAYTSGTIRLIMYCYGDNDTYLGYKSVKLTDIGTTNSYQWALYNGTKKVVFFTSTNVLSGEHLCVSKEDLPSFTPYSLDTTVLIPERIEFGNNKLYGTKIVNFGDSIFGNKRPPNDISTAIANKTGATVYNLGFGGCRMSASHNADWDAFSMASIATAIASNDFTDQDAVDISTAGMPTYFTETLALLKSIDFANVDAITIAYGTNDFGQSVDFDNQNNLYDKTTFCGALRYSIETLMTAYPQLKVFVCTPTYRFWMTEQGEFINDSDTEVRNGKKLTDYVQAVIEIAESYHVSSIDNYYTLGINKFNRSHWFPETDGTHHNKLGGILIAEHMINEMF